MERRVSLGFKGALLMAAIYFFGAGQCEAQPQTEMQSHDMEAARARMERRVTDQERKAVAARRARQYPALAARIAKTRAALINARDARVAKIKALNATNTVSVNAQGGSNE